MIKKDGKAGEVYKIQCNVCETKYVEEPEYTQCKQITEQIVQILQLVTIYSISSEDVSEVTKRPHGSKEE